MKLRQNIIVILIALCLPAPTLAAVDWSVDKTIETKTAIKNMATSFDGKTFFILTKAGELVMYDDNGIIQGNMKVAPGMDKIFLSGFQKAGVPEQLIVVNSTTGQMQQLSFSVVAKIDITGSPFLGNPEAPVALVVFSDFQ
ncbi:MAG: hypothetical protein KKD73_13910 [Proteobacteria bacterium]|nr:hypothetical protein [Pseudomonadota bacterium]MBU1639317.1 hypothetical protein [Pseudomonadota bacterium]